MKPHTRPSGQPAETASRVWGRAAATGIVILAAATWPATAWSQPNARDGGYGHMGGGWGHMMGWGGGGMFGGVGMILVWGILIVLAVFLVRGVSVGWPLQSRSAPPQAGSTALDILKERYARGEISKAEYEERRKALAD